MVQHGRTVKDVLRAQLPGFDTLDTYGRYLAEKGLRAAIARRRKYTASSAPPSNKSRFRRAENRHDFSG